MLKNPLLRVYADSKKYWFGLSVIFIFTIFAGVFKTSASVFWGEAIDFGISGNIQKMLLSAVFMAGIMLLDGIRTAVQYKIIGHTTEGMFLDFRTRAFRKINKGDVSTLETKFRTGDTATRLNSNIDELSKFIAGGSNFLRLIFQGIFATIGCFFLSWQLSLAYFILLPISIFLVKQISKPLEMQKKKSLDSTGSAMSLASDVISGILTVKSFGIQGEMSRRFANLEQQAYTQSVKTEKVGMAMTGIKYVTSVIQVMTLFLVGSLLLSKGLISVGTLVAFVTLSYYISESFEMIDYMLRMTRQGVATAHRLYEVLDIEDEKDGTVTEMKEHASCIHTQGLKFSYSEGDNVLNGIDIKVGKNQKVALIGSSGCGKSTLLKIMCRFYVPTEGELDIFATSTTDWNVDSLRKNISLVTQEACLFDGSIFENIAYGREGTTRDEVEHALKEVGLWEFVSHLDGGMDYSIGEFGGQLSGGQRQRICIARAFVKNAPLVLLDEATSALDTQSEYEVKIALDKLLVGKSAIIVAHRLTTVQNVDYIYYLEKGIVTEEGSPSDLLKLKGNYYKMCEQQGLIT